MTSESALIGVSSSKLAKIKTRQFISWTFGSERAIGPVNKVPCFCKMQGDKIYRVRKLYFEYLIHQDYITYVFIGFGYNVGF
jgi:hypothetical protein